MTEKLIKWEDIRSGMLIRLVKEERDVRYDCNVFRDETVKTRTVVIRVDAVLDENSIHGKVAGTFTKSHGWTTIEMLEPRPLANGYYLWKHKTKPEWEGSVVVKDGQVRRVDTDYWTAIDSFFGKQWYELITFYWVSSLEVTLT